MEGLKCPWFSVLEPRCEKCDKFQRLRVVVEFEYNLCIIQYCKQYQQPLERLQFYYVLKFSLF